MRSAEKILGSGDNTARYKQRQKFSGIFWIIWRTGARFQVLFNLATFSNYSITNYVKIPVSHFFENMTGFQLVKQNRFAKICRCNKEKGQPKKMFWFVNHFIKNVKSFNEVLQTKLVKFCKLNSFFVFLYLIKSWVRTSRSTQI